jgi:hypothetical protein
MSWLKYGWLLFFLPASLIAQYIGDSRPWTAVQSRDSLSAVNQRITGDSTAGLYREGLSFDLDYYFTRNVVDIACYTTDYTSWADKRWDNYADGTHSDDATNFKTDAQSIGMTTETPAATGDGIHIDFADMDLAHFADGDTSTTADYICFAIYTTTQDIADMADANALRLSIHCDARTTISNRYYTVIDDAALSNGWNYIKVAKSAFTTVGSPSWGTITGVAFFAGSGGDGQINETSIDNIQMVRKDPVSVKPNSFQRELTEGVWIDEWEQVGNHNFIIANESGELSAFGLENASEASGLVSSYSFNNYKVSGSVKAGTTYPTLFSYGSGIRWLMVGANTLRINAGGYQDYTTTHVNVVAGDLIYYEAERRDSTLIIRISEDHQNWDAAVYQATGAAYANAMAPSVTSYSADHRNYSFGLSSVNYAARAGVADGLLNLGIRYDVCDGIGMFKFTVGDSIYFLAADSVTAAP